MVLSNQNGAGAAATLAIVTWNGDWRCACGSQNKLWDSCSTCGQSSPCREYVRGNCTLPKCRFPHPAFQIPDSLLRPSDPIANPPSSHPPPPPLFDVGDAHHHLDTSTNTNNIDADTNDEHAVYCQVAPTMSIVSWLGHWQCHHCGGKVHKLWDVCKCGQPPPCREWVRGQCDLGKKCKFPHPPFVIPPSLPKPEGCIANPTPAQLAISAKVTSKRSVDGSSSTSMLPPDTPAISPMAIAHSNGTGGPSSSSSSLSSHPLLGPAPPPPPPPPPQPPTTTTTTPSSASASASTTTPGPLSFRAALLKTVAPSAPNEEPVTTIKPVGPLPPPPPPPPPPRTTSSPTKNIVNALDAPPPPPPPPPPRVPKQTKTAQQPQMYGVAEEAESEEQSAMKTIATTTTTCSTALAPEHDPVVSSPVVHQQQHDTNTSHLVGAVPDVLGLDLMGRGMGTSGGWSPLGGSGGSNAGPNVESTTTSAVTASARPRDENIQLMAVPTPITPSSVQQDILQSQLLAALSAAATATGTVNGGGTGMHESSRVQQAIHHIATLQQHQQHQQQQQRPYIHRIATALAESNLLDPAFYHALLHVDFLPDGYYQQDSVTLEDLVRRQETFNAAVDEYIVAATHQGLDSRSPIEIAVASKIALDGGPMYYRCAACSMVLPNDTHSSHHHHHHHHLHHSTTVYWCPGCRSIPFCSEMCYARLSSSLQYGQNHKALCGSMLTRPVLISQVVLRMGVEVFMIGSGSGLAQAVLRQLQSVQRSYQVARTVAATATIGGMLD